MAKYLDLLRQDLIQQFREKPVIDALIGAVGQQMDDIRQYFDDLRTQRNVSTAVGKQLDGIGNIVELTRSEAGELACAKSSVHVLEDDPYRKYLIYKIWRNTNNCTYADVMHAFRMFWDKPLYYKEDPNIPATMVLQTDLLPPGSNVEELLSAPFIKAAGVAIKVIAITQNPEMPTLVPIAGCGGNGYSVTVLPEIENDPLDDNLYVIPSMQTLDQTITPEIDLRPPLDEEIYPVATARNLSHSKVPEMKE